MDKNLRLLRLQKVHDIQQEIFDLASEWGTVWQRDGTAPESNRIPDLYTLLVRAMVILEHQMKEESEEITDDEITRH